MEAVDELMGEIPTLKPPPAPAAGSRPSVELSTAELVRQIEESLAEATPTLKLKVAKPGRTT